MAERLTLVSRVREVWSSNPGPFKSLANGSPPIDLTSTQFAVLSWRYNAEMGAANTLHASA